MGDAAIDVEALAGATIVAVEAVEKYGDDVGLMQLASGYGIVRLTLADGRVIQLTSCSCCEGLHVHEL